MCLIIDYNVRSLNKRIVWKVFDRSGNNTGKIVSVFLAFAYPKGKLIERSPGPPTDILGRGTRGLHFYLSAAVAKRYASHWPGAYIAKFAVDPKDFMFASVDGEEVMYERATRIGNYIKVG